MRILAAVLLSLSSATAEKDSTFYPDGMENPNVENKMYWHEGLNVIEDISQFDALYITHHGCVWSEYDDGSGNGCNYQGAMDEESWYMTLAPCYRANTAYSLYGVLKGDKDRGCNAKTYINSFFTSAGVETFSTYMGYAGATFSSGSDDEGYAGGVSSDCEAAQNGDDAANEEEGGNNNNNNNNNNNGYAHGDNVGNGKFSYGLGCSADGEYKQKTFQGQYCSESDKSKVTDKLAGFNGDMSKIECTQIYSSSAQNNNNNNNGGNGGSALNLLTYSQSCSVLEYPSSCPDPYGKLLKYERRLEDSTGIVHNKRKERVRKAMSWLLFLSGLLLIAVAFISYSQRKAKKNAVEQAPVKKPTFWQRITAVFRRKGGKNASARNKNNRTNGQN